MKDGTKIRKAYATDRIPSGRDGITFGAMNQKTPDWVQNAVARAHINFGHCSKDDLVKILGRVQCSNTAIMAAKHLRCATCERCVGRKRARPARVRVTERFGDVLDLDCFMVKDVDNTPFLALSIVDNATFLHVATVAESLRASHIAAAFEACWVSWAGPPIHVHMDGGFEFEGVFGILLDSLGVECSYSGGDDQHQNGKAERHGGWVKLMYAKIRAQKRVRGYHDVVAAINACTFAKKDLRRRCGHSPAQWVLGRSPRAFTCLIDGSNNIPSHSFLELDP